MKRSITTPSNPVTATLLGRTWPRSESPGLSCCSCLPSGATRTATAFSAPGGWRATSSRGVSLSWSARCVTRSTSPSCTRWLPSSASPTTSSSSAAVPLEETAPFYQAADLLVYPSLNETFGLPILEAMACACPVVTSDVERDARDGRRCGRAR